MVVFSAHLAEHKSIQSTRLSIQSSELGPPTLSPASESCSAPLGSRGETHSFAGDLIPTKGQTLWYSTVYYNPPTLLRVAGHTHHFSSIPPPPPHWSYGAPCTHSTARLAIYSYLYSSILPLSPSLWARLCHAC